MDTEPDTSLREILCCPRCRAPLQAAGALACTRCEAAYPHVGGCPWLYADPDGALASWKGRARALLAHLERQAAHYRAALTPDLTRTSTRNRLKLLAQACDDHARRLRALLAPVGLGEQGATAATYAALAPDAGPGIAAYYANVHRDWCWGETENAAAGEAVLDALGAEAAGRTLVLGAGAGRLAYDLHEALALPVTVAVDVNPLLGFVARRMYAGERLELYEFPVAPRDLASHAVLRTLSAPRAARPGLHVVLADAMRPPFAPGLFDTVVTPWLVDVIDADLAAFAATVNGLLAPGGRWVCTGTFFFRQRDAAQAHATEEALEVIGAAGFERPEPHVRRVPYLASPASRHARQEEIVTFAARRLMAAPAPPARSDWQDDWRRPVPLPQALADHALSLRVAGYVASLVDGRRSVADIAARLVEERLLLPDEAGAVVHEFVVRLHDESRHRPWQEDGP